MSLPINPTSAQVAALTTTQVAALTLGELRYTVAETGEAVMSALAPKQVVALRRKALGSLALPELRSLDGAGLTAKQLEWELKTQGMGVTLLQLLAANQITRLSNAVVAGLTLTFYWLVQGEGANDFHPGCLQPDANGDELWLAIEHGLGEIRPRVAERQPKPRYGAQKPAEIRFQGATRGFKCSIHVCQNSIAGGVRGKLNNLLSLFGLANLVLARRRLLAPDGQVAS